MTSRDLPPTIPTMPWSAALIADVVPLLNHLRARPDDDHARGVLSDLLDEHGPTPVEYHELPRWFRLCWCRCVPKMASEIRGPRARFQIEREIQHVLEGRPSRAWDHWGRTTIAGFVCLVVEPYAPHEHTPGLLAPLADLMPGTVHAHAYQGAWFRSTARGLLFPPLAMPPPRRQL